MAAKRLKDGELDRDAMLAATRKARAFAAEHLSECAAEILAWHKTSTLVDGKVRELGVICSQYDENNSLRQAEREVEMAALEFATRRSTLLTPAEIKALMDVSRFVMDRTGMRGMDANVVTTVHTSDAPRELRLTDLSALIGAVQRLGDKS